MGKGAGQGWLTRGAAWGSAAALALAGLYPGSNPDTFGHLAQGRQIVELGRVPAVDTWSLLPAPARPWHNYEWLSDLGTYALYESFGASAVTLFKCALLALTAAMLVRASALAVRSGGEHAATGAHDSQHASDLTLSTRAALLTCLTLVSAIPAVRFRLSDRPHVLGICFAVSYLLALVALVMRPSVMRARWLVVGLLAIIHLVWINSHGSHLLGLAITACFLLFAPRPVRKPIAAALTLELLVSALSPYGPAIVVDAAQHVFDGRYRELVSEWRAWSDEDPAWLQLGPALQAALLALLLPKLVRYAPSTRALSLIAALLGIACFRSVRFVAEFMLLSAPLIGVGLGLWLVQRPVRRFLGASYAAGAVLALLVPWASERVSPFGLGVGLGYAGLPQASGRALARHGDEPRVLATMQDAWFLMFATPSAKFAIDGRVPFYGPEHVREISLASTHRPTFERVVQRLAIDTVVASHVQAAGRSLRLFSEAAQFVPVLIEDKHVLYVRRGALSLAGEQALPPLRVLQPVYALDWLLALEPASLPALHAELARLASFEGTSGYRGWVEGVLTLAPLRRGSGQDGFRWPRSEDEWARYRRAQPLIRRAGQATGHVPSVAALEAQVAAVLCEFEQADEALARALSEGASREPLLVQQELALRRGELDQVRRVVGLGRARPEGRYDPWLIELERGLRDPPRCP